MLLLIHDLPVLEKCLQISSQHYMDTDDAHESADMRHNTQHISIKIAESCSVIASCFKLPIAF